jgi:hypothetical protein
MSKKTKTKTYRVVVETRVTCEVVVKVPVGEDDPERYAGDVAYGIMDHMVDKIRATKNVTVGNDETMIEDVWTK